jgi:hypothetical protein
MPPILKTWPNKRGDLSLVGEGNLVIFCYIDTIDLVCICLSYVKGPSLPWSYISWIYNYLCNKCLSPLMLCVRISIRAKCTTLCMCCSPSRKPCKLYLDITWYPSFVCCKLHIIIVCAKRWNKMKRGDSEFLKWRRRRYFGA